MKVIISAGGTGGHIYPALAIVNKIKEHKPDSEFIYIGTHNRMEKDIIPKLKIKYIPLKVYGFTKNMFKNFENIFLLFKSYQQCLKLIKEFKPDIVIGAGGYVTYPTLKAAHKLKVKTLIHEQNAIPGKSNKNLSKFVDRICVSFKESLAYFPESKTVVTGNPCSENAINIKPANKKNFGLNLNKKLIIVVAGSLGSTSVNSKMKEYLLKVKDKDYEVVYITGKNNYDSFIHDNKFPTNVKVFPYIDNLSSLFKVSDIVVTRSGASTISELIALNVPSIYIPSPYVPNNHQYYNALKLKENNAGILIEEKNLNVDKLIFEIDNLLNDKTRYLDMKLALNKLAVKNSSELIYKEVKDLIK